MIRAFAVAFCLLAAPTLITAPAFADPAVLSIAQDRYQTGATITFDGPAVTDLFMAGNKVESAVSS